MKEKKHGEDLVLAIDLGSTSFKAALFDRQLRELAFGDAPLPHRFAVGGKVEIKIDDACECLRKAIAALDIGGLTLSAIAVTSQAQTFTFLDQSGRPTRQLLSWQDGGEESLKKQMDKALPDFGEHCSFGCLGPGLQVCQVARLLPQTRVWLAPLPSFFLHAWSGRLVTDNNIAAMSGLYSLGQTGWWNKALAACGLESRQLPEIVPVGTVAGQTTARAGEFGLPAGVPVVLAGNDQTAGGYGARLEENKNILLTLGTALVAYSFISRLPEPIPGMARGPYPKSGAYQMISSSKGGNIINWAKTVLAECDTDDRFFTVAEQAEPDCGGLIFDCDLKAGSGAWRGLGLHHTPADLARSVINSLADEAAGMIAELTVRTGKRDILAAGGGRFRPLWMNTVAEKIGAKVVPTSATPLVGAARMALDAVV